MSRPVRFLPPGTIHFITLRCVACLFLLRPDAKLNALIGYWLARAAARFAGIRVIAFVALSNHIHMIIEDQESQLSRFMEYFTGQLAKGVNELRGRTGHVFERRFVNGHVLDILALLGRLFYTLRNPMMANLVATHKQWPGLLLWADKGESVTHQFTRFNHYKYEAARREAVSRGVEPPSPMEFQDTQSLTLHPIQSLTIEDDSTPIPSPDEIHVELARSEHEYMESRRAQGKGFLGAPAVLAQDPFSSPQSPNRSRRPLCHASTHEGFLNYRRFVRLLHRTYRAASEAFREGVFSVVFPAFVHRPSTPILEGGVPLDFRSGVVAPA